MDSSIGSGILGIQASTLVADPPSFPAYSSFLEESHDAVCQESEGNLEREVGHAPTATPPAAKTRVYWLDWMRILAIYLVVVYHTVQALAWVGMWCGYQEQQQVSFRCMALQIGMPLFFHISGRAQACAKPVRFRPSAYRRFVRLMVPFFLSYVLLIPPWLWVHVRDDMYSCQLKDTVFDCADPPKILPVPPLNTSSSLYRTVVCPNPNVSGNMLMYILKYWTGSQFRLDPAWLWFLPALYFISLICTPLFLFGEFQSPEYLVPVAALCFVQSLITTFILQYKFTFSLGLCLAPLCTAVLVHCIPFPPQDIASLTDARPGRRWLAIRAVTVVYVAANLMMVMSFRYADMEYELKTLPGVFMYPLFYSHGFFAQRWWPEGVASVLYRPNRSSVDPTAQPSVAARRHVLVMTCELVTLFLVFISLFVGAPIGQWEMDTWPVYSASFLDGDTLYPMGYVLSTWVWIGLIESVMMVYAEDQVQPVLHHHISNSAMVIYVFHWIFLKFYTWFVIRDQGLLVQSWKWFSCLSTFFVTVSCSAGVYALLLRYPTAGKLFGL
eukprot:TRINITY_DN39985_c0_g1_i1.p1 TRINITY_DN39985_c0_g1~~TRINITY_DN39985_c0_g1_i1.p1  ORF type:complete len:554 (+),score=15.21 TRINITY_DN39985_c0_g1_i1:88-1749(+)